MLQFHLFMNHAVQNIPVVIPGSGSDGNIVLKFLNMLLCGSVFLKVSIWARNVTVTTQTTVTGFMKVKEHRGYTLASSQDIERLDNACDGKA